MEESKKAASLVSVLDRIFCDRNWQYRLGLNQVFLFWDEIVGKKIAALATPEVVKGDVLWVSVPDSMWMQQLHLRKMTFLEKLNQRLATEAKKLAGSSKIPVLADIRFQIGRAESVGLEREADIQVEQVIDPQRESDFDMLSRSIKDVELRQRIKRLWRGQEKRYIDSR